jgi:hypothetical protein
MNKILFLCSDTDVFYQRYRFFFVVREVAEIFPVTVVTSENKVVFSPLWETIDVLSPKNLNCFTAKKGFINYRGKGNALVERLRTDMQDVRLPNLNITFWKVSLLDDFVGSWETEFHHIPPDFSSFSAVIVPFFSVSRPPSFGGYYQFQLYRTAKEKGIPIIGVEIQTIDRRYYYQNLFYDYYIVKHKSSYVFLRELGIPEKRIFLLKKKYSSILSDSDYTFAANLKFLFDDLSLIPEVFSGKPVITLIHRLSERFAFRELLRALSQLSVDFTPVVVTHPDIHTISLREKEVVQQAYQDEIAKLPGRELLILETPRNNLSFLTLFSDIIISVSPHIVADYPFKSDDILVFNPLYQHSVQYYPEIKNFFTKGTLLISYIEKRISSDQPRCSFRNVISKIVKNHKMREKK